VIIVQDFGRFGCIFHRRGSEVDMTELQPKPEQHALDVYKCVHRALAQAIDMIKTSQGQLRPDDEEESDALEALFHIWRETADLFQGRMREEFPLLWEAAEIERLIEDTRWPTNG